ncbi:MAG: ClpXP protease specificity-enhancing factor [Betaproteobacteria bacterium]|nr:ClpXP protease specificity-enhancing factor [Betaproteobacteria bacterium]
MNDSSTKPYLIRAIFEWCADEGFTPYLAVAVDANTRVPAEFVRNGEIILNIAATATRNLTLGNDWIQFSARFNGVSRELTIPIAAVTGIFARENGQGMFFPKEEGTEVAVPPAPQRGKGEEPPEPTPPTRGKPKLQVVKK